INVGVDVRGFEPKTLEEPLGARFWASLDEMLAHVDIVRLHVPASATTRNIINSARISLMKPQAFLVNLARPELVDEDALIAAIEGGRLSGAALDVFDYTSSINSRLLALARAHKVVLTAHMGSATLESRIEMGETVIVNIRAFVDGHTPPNRVLPERPAQLAAEG
ncbi:MAG: NAD(P)-dependent oxidoreductase, partial [Cucumibacter sp.]